MKSCLLLSDQVIIQSNFITFSYCFSYDIVFYYSQRSICFLLELFVFLCTIPSLLWNFLWQFPSFLFPISLSHPFVLLCCRPAFPLCTFILFASNLFIQETFFFTLFLCRTFHLIHWSCSRSFIRRVLYFLFVFHLFLIDNSAFPLSTFFFTFSQNVSKRRIDFSISKWASST